MITLVLDKARGFKGGDVIHLRVVSMCHHAPGKWRLTAENITPLPGAEPPGYACGVCGIIESAKPDGSLPEGWTEKLFVEGSHFVCSEKICQEQQTCRVCGSTPLGGWKTRDKPIAWAEDNLCSACA